jgi:hypothetical protein
VFSRLSWIQYIGINGSGEVSDSTDSGEDVSASQVDIVAATGASNALKALGSKGVSSHLVMEGLHQPRNLHYGAFEERVFGEAEEQVTALLDPIDGTTNLRDGRFFDAASTVATSSIHSRDSEPVFGDVIVASAWFPSSSNDFNIDVCGILATPTNLWELRLHPERGGSRLLRPLDTTPRQIREVVFASYYVADPSLSKLKEKLVSAGYPVIPGCGSSTLDCLRILRLEAGAYLDVRSRLASPPAQLHTYDVGAIPFITTVLAQKSKATLNIFSADAREKELSVDHLRSLPLRPSPLSFILTKNLNPQPILDLLAD